MERVADLALQYLLLIHFGEEDVIDPDYSLSLAESLDMQSFSQRNRSHFLWQRRD
jgi:hypothetical protein